MDIDPLTASDLSKGNNSTVNLAVFVIGPRFILHDVLSFCLVVDAFRRWPRGEGQAGKDEDGFDACLLKLTKVALNTVGQGQGKTACRCNERFTLIRVLQELLHIICDVDAQTSSLKGAEGCCLSEFPLAQVD